MPAAAGYTGETAAGCRASLGEIMEQVLGDVLNDVEQPLNDVVVEEIEAAPAPDEPIDTGEVATPPVAEQDDPREKGFQAALMDERRKRQAIEKELESLRKPMPQTQQTEAPKPDDYPGGEYDPAYIAAISRHEVRQEHARIRNEEAETHRQQTINQKFNSMEQAGRSKYPDYDQALDSLVSSGIRFSEAAMEVISDSELGHEISYLLAKNPQAAFEFSRLSPSKQASELGKLEIRMQMQAQPKPEIPAVQPKPEVPQTLTQQRDTRGQFRSADSGPPSLESILS